MRRSQLRSEPAAGSGCRRAENQGRRAPRLHRDPRADRRRRRRARRSRIGEVVTPGQPVVTLINPDDLWVRADVEETYIDRVRIGDKLTGAPAVGRRAPGHGVLSRRRRRLRDAARRQPHQARHQDVRGPAALRQPRPRLAVGMTAYVLLPAVEHDRPPCSPSTFRTSSSASATSPPSTGISFQRRARRGLRPARPERRGQIDADPHADDAGAADRRARRASTASTSSKQPNDVRTSIGVIPQAMTSDLELSAEENLLIFAKLYGVPREKRARLIDELLAAVELTQWARQAGEESFGRHAPPRRDRARPGARAEDLLPRRADDRPRSGVARRGVGDAAEDQGASAT